MSNTTIIISLDEFCSLLIEKYIDDYSTTSTEMISEIIREMRGRIIDGTKQQVIQKVNKILR